MAVFDVLVNNADRKGGHVLAMPDGHRYGVDHGLTFHVEHKLRTVLWGWLGERLVEEEQTGVRRVLAEVGRRARRRTVRARHTGRDRGVLAGAVGPCSRRTSCRRRATSGRSFPGRHSEPDRLPAMRSWSSPEVPDLTVTGPAVRIHDTSVPAASSRPGPRARPGSTSAASRRTTRPTWATPRPISRSTCSTAPGAPPATRSTYVQNVTDVDDPLLERAPKVKVDWVELAERETELFRHDMEALRVLAPDHYIGAVESIPLVIDLITRLQEAGAIYEVESDLYFSVTADAAFGDVSGWSRDEMLRVFGERGGDPDREGKRDPLDCVVWRGKREGEPSWDSPFGPGRPGWHIECTAIALEHLGTAFDVQGGGSDLIFPHHEMCAGEAQVADPGQPFARAYAHAGMVAYDGEKMSKSKGNLVFVSALRNSDVDPMAIRLVLLRHHYRSDWEWTDDQLWDAVDTVAQWRKALIPGRGRSRCAGRRAPYSPRSPTTSTPPPPSRPSTTGSPPPWATPPTASPTRATRTRPRS